MAQISVLTIVRGRRAHLENVIEGLKRQTRPPDEFVIAVMEPTLLTDLPAAPFPIRQVRVPGRELPLAAARNAAARAARGDVLVFLDVDCIPHANYLADYGWRLPDWDGLLMGEVMYLPEGATAGTWSDDRFDALAERHSDRRGPPQKGLAVCDDYRCFWSLNFALRRAHFETVGGFDESYVGYGGEDTDFGKKLSVAGIPIGWMLGGRVYHQYHPHHMPPVHHIDSILRNAELFRSKWGYRTMGHWIRGFEMMGLVRATPDALELIRTPAAGDLALTRQTSKMPFANTARVIRILEERTAAAD